MKTIFMSLLFAFPLVAQVPLEYAVNTENPYGKIHPDAPKEVADYAPLIDT
ncbi:MAG: hypothetical protein HKM28_03280, partial [Flavobacteriaceae bacterium]|nr:hypothetical protein [Flavobacteriaceae bacterium]